MFDFVDNFTCFIAFGEMTFDLMTAPQSWPSLTLLGGTWLFAVGAMWGQTFTDGDPSGVLYTEHVGGYLGHGVSFADFNADGNDDLTFTQFEGQIGICRGRANLGASRPWIWESATRVENPSAALWADFDNDGDQDLFVTQRLSNKLYARMPDGTLQEVPNAGAMGGTELERSYGASVADYDKNGRLDVYICHYHTPQTNSEPNRLFRSGGGVDMDMVFEDVTEAAGVGNGGRRFNRPGWTWTATVGSICTSSTTESLGRRFVPQPGRWHVCRHGSPSGASTLENTP